MGVRDIFEEYYKGSKIFKNKKALTTEFEPNNIPHRKGEIKTIARILAPIVRGEKPSNLFIYGKTGTGKTLCVRYVLKEMEKYIKERGGRVKIIYINCKIGNVSSTEYRFLSTLLLNLSIPVPKTGLSSNELFNRFFKHLKKEREHILLILDEIDALVEKSGDNVLYNLTRINHEIKNIYVVIVGISNNIRFKEWLDPRVLSSLSEEEVFFKPYNAKQLIDILKDRIREAFFNNVVDEATINKCAALAAQEHGDARRALDMIRIAGEIAERRGEKKISIQILDEAQKKLDRDKIIESLNMITKQAKTILLSIIENIKRKGKTETGEVYTNYIKLCKIYSLNILTQRRVSDIIAELDMMNIITTVTLSKGRYGKTREITINLPSQTIIEMEKFLKKNI